MAAVRGFTLVELLVVVMILLLVTGITIPLVAPALQGRHVREASRQVNSYLAVARDSALRTGRPVGVKLERFVSRDEQGNIVGSNSEFCVVLSQVEVPDAYAGDYSSSQAIIDPTTNPPTVTWLGMPDAASPPGTADVGWTDMILAGDVIQFNYQGRFYELGGMDGVMPAKPIPPGQPLKSLPWTLTPTDGSGVLPWVTTTAVPYRIIRQPVPTSVEPLQLTGTVVIDLNWSSDSEVGGGFFVQRDSTTLAKLTLPFPPDTTSVEDSRSVIIMFSPNGSLERVYRSFHEVPQMGNPYWKWEGRLASGPVHLLIGEREAVPANATADATSQEANNWRRLDSLWVSIHPQTGQISTTENAEVTDAAEQANPYVGMPTARQYATRAQNMGGR